MKIVITGSTGYIGTKLTSSLNSKSISYKVINRSDISINTRDSWDKIDTILTGCDTIIHLLGIAHARGNQYERNEYYRINYEFTELLALRAIEAGVDKFIFISSINTYLIDELPVINRELEFNSSNLNPYSLSKLMAEKRLQQLSANGHTKFVSIGSPLVYGNNPKANLLKLYRWLNYGLPVLFPKTNQVIPLISIERLVLMLIAISTNDQEEPYLKINPYDFLSQNGYYSIIKFLAEITNSRSKIIPMPINFLLKKCSIFKKNFSGAAFQFVDARGMVDSLTNKVKSQDRYK